METIGLSLLKKLTSIFCLILCVFRLLPASAHFAREEERPLQILEGHNSQWVQITQGRGSNSKKYEVEGTFYDNPQNAFSALSEKNLEHIVAEKSPYVDSHWVQHFPEHQNYIGQKLEHHHLDQGVWSVPLPGNLHRKDGNYSKWHDK